MLHRWDAVASGYRDRDSTGAARPMFLFRPLANVANDGTSLSRPQTCSNNFPGAGVGEIYLIQFKQSWTNMISSLLSSSLSTHSIYLHYYIPFTASSTTSPNMSEKAGEQVRRNLNTFIFSHRGNAQTTSEGCQWKGSSYMQSKGVPGDGGVRVSGIPYQAPKKHPVDALVCPISAFGSKLVVISQL